MKANIFGFYRNPREERACNRGFSRVRAQFGEESGEATLEFVGVVLGLLVPLVYFILVLFEIQAGMYAAESGAAASARILTEHPQTGGEAAQLTVELAASDQGLPADGVSLAVTCEAGECPAPGSRGEVKVDVSVPLPVVGTMLEGLIPASLNLSSVHPIKWGEHGA